MTALSSDPIFEAQRPALFGLAYRLLGSRVDAEDAVQDTFVRWTAIDRAAVVNPAAWLTTACTRRCIDLLRSAHRQRVDYVGPWLPEPLPTDDLEAEGELASSLSTAFLLVLERLAPRERAAYLLREVFERPYPEVAATLETSEQACRKLVQRAKEHVDEARMRHRVDAAVQDRLLDAFAMAVREGDTAPLAALLTADVELRADGGGKATAARAPLLGRDTVLAFVTGVLHVHWGAFTWERRLLNGGLGFVLRQQGRAVATVAFALDEGGVRNIFIMRNPDKLAGLAPPA